MSHTILYVVVSVLSFVSQSVSQALIHGYGFKLAVTSADQKFENTYLSGVETKRRVGFNIGGYIEWFDSHFFTLVTQLEYVQKGMGQRFAITVDDPTVIEYKDFYSRLDYLSLPLLGKFFLSGESLSPFILVGPRADFLLGYNSDENVFNSVYDDFMKTVIGGTLGAGIEITGVLPLPLAVEARYNIDFADSYNTQFLKVRNNAFDFWLGIKL